MTPHRPLPPMPPRIARLDRDRRGYPIPWNVLRGIDGRPYFIVNNSQRQAEAIVRELCPLCGERLGRWRWFVGGPRSAFHPQGWYLDLPGHHECITFALQVCPYLATPQYSRYINAPPDPTHVPPEVRFYLDATVEPDKPPLFVTLAGERIEIKEDPPSVFVRPTRPYLGVEYWRDGVRLPDPEGLALVRGVMGFGPDWEPPLL